MKTGLVMEGGAMRGLFTVGIIDVLLENNVTVDGAIGVSAGAAFGCNLKSRQIGRALRYNTKYCRDKRYCSFKSLITTGDLYGEKFCYHEIPEKLDVFDTEAFNNNPMEFYVVATDVNTGKAVYTPCNTADGDYIEWIRASASMPLVSKVVKIGELELLDGGIADSIPLKYFESIGYNKNIVILTQPEGYVKKKNSLIPIMKFILKKYPKLLKTMENRHIVYNETVEYIRQKELAGEILVIRPREELGVGKIEHNPENIKRAYEIGRKAGLSNLQKIKDFLGE